MAERNKNMGIKDFPTKGTETGEERNKREQEEELEKAEIEKLEKQIEELKKRKGELEELNKEMYMDFRDVYPEKLRKAFSEKQKAFNEEIQKLVEIRFTKNAKLVDAKSEKMAALRERGKLENPEEKMEDYLKQVEEI